MSIYLSVCTDRVVLNGLRVNESGHFSKYLSWCPWQLATWLKVTLMYCYEILERQQICVNTVALSSPQELLGIQSTDVSQLQTKGSNGSSKPRDIYKRPTCTNLHMHKFTKGPHAQKLVLTALGSPWKIHISPPVTCQEFTQKWGKQQLKVKVQKAGLYSQLVEGAGLESQLPEL